MSLGWLSSSWCVQHVCVGALLAAALGAAGDGPGCPAGPAPLSCLQAGVAAPPIFLFPACVTGLPQGRCHSCSHPQCACTRLSVPADMAGAPSGYVAMLCCAGGWWSCRHCVSWLQMSTDVGHACCTEVLWRMQDVRCFASSFWVPLQRDGHSMLLMPSATCGGKAAFASPIFNVHRTSCSCMVRVNHRLTCCLENCPTVEAGLLAYAQAAPAALQLQRVKSCGNAGVLKCCRVQCISNAPAFGPDSAL